MNWLDIILILAFAGYAASSYWLTRILTNRVAEEKRRVVRYRDVAYRLAGALTNDGYEPHRCGAPAICRRCTALNAHLDELRRDGLYRL